MKDKKRVVLGLSLSFILLPLSFSFAHPGAVDKDGCHKVTKDYKYTGSTKVLKAGTTHCHAGVGKMRLGKEMLGDPNDSGTEVKPAKTKGKK